MKEKFAAITIARNSANNPTGRSSVTANVIHKIGLPDHEWVMNRPMVMHATNAIHHSGLCVVKYAIRSTATIPPEARRKSTRYRYAIVPNENSQMPRNVPFRTHI